MKYGRGERRAAMVLPWSCGVVVLAGTVATLSRIPYDLRSEYITIGAVAAAAGFAVARSTALPGPMQVMRGLVLATFVVGYYAQAWWMLVDTGLASGDWIPEALGVAANPRTVVASLGHATWAFAASALLLTLLDRWPITLKDAQPISRGEAKIAAGRLLGVALAATFVILPTMYVFDIALMGTDDRSTVRFRLAGWCVYGLRILVPTLCLVVIRIGEAVKSRLFHVSGVALLGGSAFGDFLVTTSKGGLVFALARYVVLMLIVGRLTAGRIRVAAFAAAAIALLFPLMMEMRVERAAGAGLTRTIETARVRPTSEGEVLSGIRLLVMRFSGTGALAPIARAERSIPHLAVSGALGGPSISTYTNSLYGVGPDDATSFAPGLLGWLYVACGPRFMAVGMCALLLLIELFVRSANGIGLWTKPEALTMGAILILVMFNDGLIEMTLLPALAILGSVAGAEFVVRASRRKLARGRGSTASLRRRAAVYS